MFGLTYLQFSKAGTSQMSWGGGQNRTKVNILYALHAKDTTVKYMSKIIWKRNTGASYTLSIGLSQQGKRCNHFDRDKIARGSKYITKAEISYLQYRCKIHFCVYQDLWDIRWQLVLCLRTHHHWLKSYKCGTENYFSSAALIKMLNQIVQKASVVGADTEHRQSKS